MRIRIGATLLATLLGGCVYYPQYAYVADPSGDYYYEPGYDDGYHGYVSVGYGYDYGWPGYWYGWFPTYAWYPGWGAYYGVTWAPRWGWGWYDSWAWYHAYSPYRYSYYDSYYDWHGHGHHGHHGHGGHDGPRGGAGGNDGDPRFGSASNEAERLANMDAPRGSGFGYLRSTPGGATPRWSRDRDAGNWQGYPDVRTGEPATTSQRYYPGDTRFSRSGGYAPGATPSGNWSRGRDAGASGGGYAPAPSYAPARSGPSPGRSAPAPGRDSGGGGFDRGSGGFDRGGSSGGSSGGSRDFGNSGHGGNRDRDPD